MANNRNKRLRPEILQKDREAYAALLALEDYNPSNPEFSKEKVKEAFDDVDKQQTLEVQKDAAADAQRDTTVESEWKAHDKIQGVKIQTKAQYGENSNEYASLGLKKKNEYRTGGRRPPPANTSATT